MTTIRTNHDAPASPPSGALARRGAARLGLVLAVLAVAFPLAGLWPLNSQFYVDWHNHVWLAGYPGEYLRRHAAFPVVINTSELAGMPIEVFYASTLYPLVALLTAWCRPELALRLVAVVVMALQFRLVSRALVEHDVSPWTARAAAALVVWATYPLTNLYHRNAIPEFVATGLLTCAVALWFLVVRAPTRAARVRRAFAFGFVFALMAGSHPITALFSVPIVALLVVLTLLEHRRDRAFCVSLIKELVLPGVLVLVALGPWIYALARYQPLLQISGTLVGVWFYPGIDDDWKTRFALLPTDARVAKAPLSAVSTPYLDAQLNLALALLVLGWLAVVVARRRGLRLASLGAVAPYVATFALFTWMSMSPTSYDYLPKSAKLIQIAYRSITYQNLACLLALFGLAGVLRRRGGSDVPARAPALVVVAALALSATGVVVKLQHVFTTITPTREPLVVASADERRSWGHLPPEWYAKADYMTPSLYEPLGGAERASLRAAIIPIGADEAFGKPQPLRLEAASDTWFSTNVQAFPWNRLVLDGAIVPRSQLRLDDVRLAVRAGPGTHTLELRTVADRPWIVARVVSFSVILAWLAWLLVASARAALAGRAPIGRAATPASDSGIQSA